MVASPGPALVGHLHVSLHGGQLQRGVAALCTGMAGGGGGGIRGRLLLWYRFGLVVLLRLGRDFSLVSSVSIFVTIMTWKR